MEDLAALLGLTFAFLGVLLSVLTGSGTWDGAGSVAVGLLLVCASFIVGYEIKSLLIGEAASPEVSSSIVAALEQGPEGFRVIHLRTSHVGPESLLVAAKVAVPGALSAADLVARIDAAERRVREAVPIAETIYLEPDIYAPGREDTTDPSIQIVRTSRARRARLPARPYPSAGDPTRAAPPAPDAGDSGRSAPSAPAAGDSGRSAPSAPAAGDSGRSAPSAPDAGDSGRSAPPAPDAGDSSHRQPP
jgi:hypothetical protein